MKLILLVLALLAQTLKAGEWEFGIAAGGARFMDYPASGHYRFLGLPLPYALYRGEKIEVGEGGLNYKILNSEVVKLNFSMGGSLPASSDDNPLRQGLPELHTLFEVGPRLQLNLVRQGRYDLTFKSPVRPVFSLQWTPEFKGVNWAPSLEGALRHGPWQWGLSLGATLSSKGLHQNYYQVENSQHHLDYQVTRGGIMELEIDGSLSWKNERLSVYAGVGASSFGANPNSDSPLHAANYAWQVGLGAVLKLYEFKF